MENQPGGLKAYWKRRRASKSLSLFHRRKTQVVYLNSGEKSTQKRRFWRFRVKPKIRLLRKVITSPSRILKWIRDGYVNMMLRFAGSMSLGYSGEAGMDYMRPAVKEYDERVILEIYKTLIAQGHTFVGANEKSLILKPSSVVGNNDGGKSEEVR